jgi:hypothetical protein
MKDLHHDMSGVQSLAPAARTASANGTGVDLRGYEGALVLVDAGAYTDGAHAFTLEESDDDSTYTDVAAADILGSEPTIDDAAEDNMVYTFGYRGGKRYVRVVQTVTGSPSTGLIAGAAVLRGRPHHAPVS